jgi:hypothetical protein
MSVLRTTWRLYGLLTLAWLLSTSGFGHAGDLLQGKPLTEGDDLLRVPVSPWVQLTVDVEEYRPFVEYVDHSSSVTRSLAILPSLRVVPPTSIFSHISEADLAWVSVAIRHGPPLLPCH